MARGESATRAPRGGIRGQYILPALLSEGVLLVVVLLVLGRFYLAAGIVAVCLVLLVVPFRGRSAPGWLWQLTRYTRRGPLPHVAADVPLDLVPLAEWVPGLTVSQTAMGREGELGVITDGQAWTAVLALTADDDLLADKGEEIDLDALSGLTVQDDIVFAGVQVVTYTVPAPTTVLLGGESAAAKGYREITSGPVPPTMRRTWLCLRLDPRLCLEAVARRGVSNEGVFATLRFGLHRVQTVLKRRGIETHALTPLEIYEVLSLASGSGPENAEHRSAEGWDRWTCDGLVHSGCMVRSWGGSASAGYQALQEVIASAPVLFAVTSYTLSPTGATGAVRVVTPDPASADEALRSVSTSLSGEVRFSSAAGEQVPAMLSTVPLGRAVR